jgi:hypothetical protein
MNGYDVTSSPKRRRRAARSSHEDFLSIADRLTARLLRVDCSLEQLQVGIGQVQQALADFERIVRDERLRS